MCDDDHPEEPQQQQQQHHHHHHSHRYHDELLTSDGLRADEWSYVGEGGRHAVFVQVEVEGDDSTCTKRTTRDSTPGTRVRLSSLQKSPFRILRVAKDDLARCGEESLADAAGPDHATPLSIQSSENHNASVESTEIDCHNIKNPDPSQNAFIWSIVGLLVPYVDHPHSVLLSGKFLKNLWRRALASGRIPPARRPDWAPPKNGVPRSSGPAWGTLLQDYRELQTSNTPLVREPSLPSPTICVEIKPKAGYCAISPLVHPERRIKYQCSRFVLLQELWKQGVVNKPWDRQSSNNVTAPRRMPSAYDPLDLFSTDRIRISRALESLFANPQNNVKLWLQGKQLSSASPSDDDWDALGQALRIPSTARTCSTFAFILSEILAHEPFLQRLFELQQLDVLDGDGAVLVYQQLVELCGGNHTLAESLLDDRSAMNMKSLNSPHELLKKSPFFPPDNPTLVTQFCEIAQEIRDVYLAHGTIPCSVVEELHQRAKNLIAVLEVDACCYLLQNWLLSLTMNDISFFLTLRVSDSCAGNGSQPQFTSTAPPISGLVFARSHDKGTTPIRLRIMSLQSHDEPGLAMLFTDHTTTCLLQYQIKVIDWDPKPAKKLRERKSKESIFSFPALESFAASRANASKNMALIDGQSKEFIDVNHLDDKINGS